MTVLKTLKWEPKAAPLLGAVKRKQAGGKSNNWRHQVLLKCSRTFLKKSKRLDESIPNGYCWGNVVIDGRCKSPLKGKPFVVWSYGLLWVSPFASDTRCYRTRREFAAFMKKKQKALKMTQNRWLTVTQDFNKQSFWNHLFLQKKQQANNYSQPFSLSSIDLRQWSFLAKLSVFSFCRYLYQC